jgi:radical SAM superfamily enzyme YgiQ (UPF0313 family)
MILINPPTPFLVDDKVFPYLGVLQVATSWREIGIDVKVRDLNGDKKWKETLKDIAKEDTMFGLTSTVAQFKYAYEVKNILKSVNPDAFVMIGGAYATAISTLRRKGLIDHNTRSLAEFDMIVSGDGENPAIGLNKWISMPLIDIDQVPMADRSLIDILSYHYQIAGRSATTIMTQRGCPFQCEYCSGRDIEMYRTARQRDIHSVVEEMDELNEKFGYSAFMWFDDEININPQRLNSLCELLKGRNYRHRGFVRGDLLVRHPETLDSMAEAGFVELCSGVESGSDRILQIIHKGTTDEINRKAAELIRKSGMRYKAFTIIGHPSETYEDAMRTKRFIQEVKPDSFDVTVMMPFPGSKMYDNAVPSTRFKGFNLEYKGLYLNRPDFAREDTFYKGQGVHPVFTRTDELSSEDISKLREELLCA